MKSPENLNINCVDGDSVDDVAIRCDMQIFNMCSKTEK